MQKYNKFWIAAIGLVLMGLKMFGDIDFGIDAAGAYQFIISAMVALGVVTVGNK